MSKTTLYDSDYYNDTVNHFKWSGYQNKLGGFNRAFAQANLMFLLGSKCVTETAGPAASKMISTNKMLSAILKEDRDKQGIRIIEGVKAYEEDRIDEQDRDFIDRLDDALQACKKHWEELFKTQSR